MTSFTKDDAAKALELLADTAALRHDALNAFPTAPIHPDHDEESDSDCPIIDIFVGIGGEEALLKMTNFTRPEFERIYGKITEFVTMNWKVGRGRTTPHKAKDKFFMMLSTLKRGGHSDYMASVFRTKGSVFQRMVKSFLLLVSEHLYDGIVVEIQGRNKMKHLASKNKLFMHHPYALYATDVTFQQTNRPSENHQERKISYSAKHKLYGYKMEVSVLSTGLAACASHHRPGLVSDLTMFREMHEFHKTATEKRSDQLAIPEHGLLRSKYPNNWAILADKGYQGAADELRVLCPKKKKPHRMLSFDNEEGNRELSSDRVVVENYFGRMTRLWEVKSCKYRWAEELYDPIVQACVVLTNIYMFWHPLRDQDNERYQQLRSKWYTIGEGVLKKRPSKSGTRSETAARGRGRRRGWGRVPGRSRGRARRTGREATLSARGRIDATQGWRISSTDTPNNLVREDKFADDEPVSTPSTGTRRVVRRSKGT